MIARSVKKMKAAPGGESSGQEEFWGKVFRKRLSMKETSEQRHE